MPLPAEQVAQTVVLIDQGRTQREVAIVLFTYVGPTPGLKATSDIK